MSGLEHHSTVDKGLKMKIKRTKNSAAANSNKSDPAKHEIVKGAEKGSQSGDKGPSGSGDSQSGGPPSTNGATPVDKVKHTVDKDKSPKAKGMYRKERVNKDTKSGKAGEAPGLAAVSTTLDAAFSQVSLEPKQAENAPGRTLPDPYEFNAKVEDGIGVPVKKIKSEKDKGDGVTTEGSVDRCVGTDTRHVATEMDPDCLGPCDPGTHVTLDGIVWQETDTGVLVVNVTWRGKTYVGTLLDATKHDWAPPRPNCDSPVSDFETRTPKGRAKRGRGASVGTPVNDKILEGRKLRKGRRGSSVCSNTFQAPPSPAKSDTGTPSGGVKRKGRPLENDSTEKANKRSRSCSRGTPQTDSSNSSGTVMLECPEPNCNKKYKDSNALKYHQSHKHNNTSSVNVEADDDSRDMCMDNNEDSILDDLENNTADTASDVNISAMGDSKVDIENMEEDSVCSTSVNIPKKKSEETVKEEESSAKKTENVKDENTNSASKTSNEPISGLSSQKKEASNTNVKSPQSVQQTVTIAAATPFHIVPTTVTSFSGSIQTGKPVTSVQSSPITAAIVTATPIQPAIPITVTATTAQMLDIKHDHAKPSEKLIRPKTTINRPIMPSNMIALSTSVSVTQTNMTPVTSHMPASTTSQLKPIQPKPVLGDQPAVNPVLLGLNRDKKLKPKKKPKDKEPAVSLPTASPSSTPFSTSNPSFSSSGKKPPVKLDGSKHEPQGVIKVAPIQASKPFESTVQKTEVNPVQRIETDTKHFGANVGVIAAQVQPMKGVDLSARPPDQQPSVLKVTPSLHIPSDSSKNITDDVQSPAYSDISDANDGGSPSPMPRSESPQSKMEDANNKPKEAVLPSAHVSGDGQSSYGMYGQYYGQSNFLMSNLPSSTHSPSAVVSGQKPPVAAVQGKDRGGPSGGDSKVIEGQSRDRREDNKDDKRDGSGNKMEGVKPLNHPEYHQLHQKWVQQQMMYVQTLPHHAQYQYMAAYGSYMDPAYHMQMMSTDPYYRQHFEKMVEEQRRTAEGGRGDSDSTSRPTSRSSIDLSQGQRSSSAGPSGSEDGKREEQRRVHESSSFPESRDKNVREKQSENPPGASKDSIEKMRVEPSDPYKMSHQRMTEEQQRRYMMYQQQKMIEQQKREEQRKAEGDNNKPSDFNTKSASSAIGEKRDVKKETARPELVKRESDPKSKSSVETESKSASDDKSRSQSLEKHRNMETPKSKVGLINKASSPHTPSSSMPVSTHSPALGPGSPYSPFMYHSQYMQSPPYGHMQFDPMYRGVSPSMMYAPGPYLHPSQLGYHVSVDDNIDKDKVPLGSTSKVSSDSESKVPDSPYHGGSSSHKIHELQEKGRPSPRNVSPVPGKGEVGQSVPTSVPGSQDKGREFSSSPPIQRHVHSHHHTHVVEAAYPVYPYSSMIPGGAPPPQQGPPPPPAAPPISHSTYPHPGPK